MNRQDMGKSLSSFRLLLKLLTKTFLLEEDTTPFGSESVQKLIETQVKSFSALAKSLEEAQLEFPGSDIKKYEDCVKSLNTLAQYLNGLRSSCGLQYDMLKKEEQRKDNGSHRQPASTMATTVTPVAKPTIAGRRAMGARISSFSLIGSLQSDQEQNASADLIEFLNHVGKPMKSLALTCKLTIEHLQDIFNSTDLDPQSTIGRSNSRSKASQPYGRQSGYESTEVFSDSAYDVGASHIQREGFKRNPTFDHMQHNLAKALEIFENANSKALKRFYSHQNNRQSGHLKRPINVNKQMSEPSLVELASGLAAAGTGVNAHSLPGAIVDTISDKAPVGEQIFLVYFFVFNLMEFSKELTNLVSCVDSLVDGDEGLPLWIARNRHSWWGRIWITLTGFPRRLRRQHVDRDIFESFDDPEAGPLPPNSDSSHHPHSSTSHAGSNHQQAPSYGTIGLRSRRRKQRLFPKPNIHNKANTLQTPVPSTFAQRWSTRLWKFLHVFRSFQVKYAVKAAISAIIMLVPAFVDMTRPYFVQYRGEWALISMLIVMVPTVGGTNIVGIYRIMGTVVGCYIGVAVYLLFPANEIMLPICCFLFALPNFYLVLCSNYPRIGQVTLLAFNLVLIQTYNRRHGDGTVPPDDEDEDEDLSSPWPSSMIASKVGSLLGGDPNDPNHVAVVWTIAFHRAVAVSIGVVIGVLVTSYIWPYEARVELRKGLSDLLLNISWLYNRLVSVYSTNLDRAPVVPPVAQKQREQSRFREFVRRTTFQERFQTPNEPRLKGKFPVGTYKNMLGSCQNILDRFLSMRLVITKDEWLESARRDFIVPVNKERREMVGNVLLYFYTIASALRLKTPLPPYLPPANNARLRLIQKIRQLPVVQNKAVMTEDNDERYIFYYAYALVMDDVIRELERLGRWSQDLFGVITPDAEFEAWFTDEGFDPLTLSPTQQRVLPSSATREAPQSPYHDVEQPYQYPTVHEQGNFRGQEQEQLTTPTSPRDRDRQLQQHTASTPGSRYRRSYLDEQGEFPDSETQSFSKYYSLDSPVNDRDGMFDFDAQDPFRDTRPASVPRQHGRLSNTMSSSQQGLSLSQQPERRSQSMFSLNSAMGATPSSVLPQNQTRLGSQGPRSRNESRSQSSMSNSSGRNYGTMPGTVRETGPGSGPLRESREGTGHSRSNSASSRPHSRGDSVVGSVSGSQLQSESVSSVRPERPLTTSISATRLSSDKKSILGQPFVQEPQQQPSASLADSSTGSLVGSSAGSHSGSTLDTHSNSISHQVSSSSQAQIADSQLGDRPATNQDD
ncbi:hypothetical protein BGZ98_008637 [Dissophora globulifera]|nr:hypothetical protein BGZ98_008637 [Dissophora globulifera]